MAENTQFLTGKHYCYGDYRQEKALPIFHHTVVNL